VGSKKRGDGGVASARRNTGKSRGEEAALYGGKGGGKERTYQSKKKKDDIKGEKAAVCYWAKRRRDGIIRRQIRKNDPGIKFWENPKLRIGEERHPERK